MKPKRKQHIKYDEGQWFAVTLKDGGYALGIIVRGRYRTKGGLGYFFGPVFSEVPTIADTERLEPSDAIHVGWFGDLHIIEGKWPLIGTPSPLFERGRWPIPTFARISRPRPGEEVCPEEIGVLVKYDQEDPGDQSTEQRTLCQDSKLVGLPRAVRSGAGAIEIKLTNLLKQ